VGGQKSDWATLKLAAEAEYIAGRQGCAGEEADHERGVE